MAYEILSDWLERGLPVCLKCQRPVESVEVERPHDKVWLDPVTPVYVVKPIVVTIICHGETASFTEGDPIPPDYRLPV